MVGVWVYIYKDKGGEGLAGAEGTLLTIHRPDRRVPLRVLKMSLMFTPKKCN